MCECVFRPSSEFVVLGNEVLKANANTKKMGLTEVYHFNNCARPALVVELIENGAIGPIIFVSIVKESYIVGLKFIPALNCGC